MCVGTNAATVVKDIHCNMWCTWPSTVALPHNACRHKCSCKYKGYSLQHVLHMPSTIGLNGIKAAFDEHIYLFMSSLTVGGGWGRWKHGPGTAEPWLRNSLSADCETLLKVLNYIYTHPIISCGCLWDIWKHRHIETRGKPSMWGLSLSWILSLIPGWLTSESQRPTCFCLGTGTASSHQRGFFTGLTGGSSAIFSHSIRTSPAREGACCRALWTWVPSPEPSQWKESTDLTAISAVFFCLVLWQKDFIFRIFGNFPKYLYVTMFPFKFILSDSVPV